MAYIAAGLQRIVELRHQFGGEDVCRVLIAEGAALDADDEPEPLHMAGQVGEREDQRRLIGLQVVQLEQLEVADQQVAGQLVWLEARKVVERLFLGAQQVAPGALLLDQEHAFPEQVDVALPVSELLDRLLERGDLPSLHTEDLEEVVIEALGLAPLVCGAGPIAGELRRPRPDLVPA